MFRTWLLRRQSRVCREWTISREFRKARLTYTLLRLPRRLSASPEHFTRLLPVQKPACPFFTQPFASGRHGLRHSSSWFSDITVAWSYNPERSPPHCIGPRPRLALWSCLADVRAQSTSTAHYTGRAQVLPREQGSSHPPQARERLRQAPIHGGTCFQNQPGGSRCGEAREH